MLTGPDNKEARDYTERIFKEMTNIKHYINRVFTNIEFKDEDVERIFKVENKGLTVVSSHRSHADYMTAGVHLIKNRFQNMRFAAGDNLTDMPILGIHFRKVGAFSVKRDKASSRAYLFQLAEFVKKLLLRGQNIIVYPEGGRSYTGRMLEFKTGIINSTVMAQMANPDKEYYFLPMTCSYSAVPDAELFDVLLKGKKLRSSPSQLKRFWGNLLYYGADLWTYFRVWAFPRNYYRIYLDTADPIPVRDLTDVEGNHRQKSKNEFFANIRSSRECCEKLHRIVLKLYRIMPVHIVSYILLCEIPADARQKAAEGILSEMKQQGFNMKGVGPASPSEVLRTGEEMVRAMKIVRGRFGAEKIKKPALLRYYAGAVLDLKGE
ncbi:MAG: 1-acyl-sn-glycerol-3-phosphate acyltransferase [Fibrobacterota bacterium]